jgi:hypothetical protein
MDKDHTNCSCLCLVESNERRPAKIEKKMVVLPLKSSYYSTRTYKRRFHSRKFQNFLEKWLRISQIWRYKIRIAGKKITLLTVLLKVHIIALINAWHQVLQVICLS